MIVRALCFEAERNNVQRCKALLADGADVNGSFSMGFRPLFYAAMAGGEATLGLLLSQRADVRAKNQEGRTCLHWAVRNGHLNCARTLIAAKAAVDVRDEEGVAPIDLATAFSKEDCVRHPEAAVFMFGTALSRQRTRLQLLHFFNDVLE